MTILTIIQVFTVIQVVYTHSNVVHKTAKASFNNRSFQKYGTLQTIEKFACVVVHAPED